MPFLPVIIGRWVEPQGLSARMLVEHNGCVGRNRRLTFILSRELIEKAGWQAGERFVLSIGTEEHIGCYQLTRATKGRTGIKLISNNRHRGFRLSYTLPPVIHGIRPAEHLDRLTLPAPLFFSIEAGSMTLSVMERAALIVPAPAEPPPRAGSPDDTEPMLRRVV